MGDVRQSWSTPSGVAAKVRRRWDSGALLTAYAQGLAWVPLSVPVSGPAVSEIGGRLDEVRAWANALERGAGRTERPAYRIEYKSVGGRLLGSNQLPVRVWLESYDEAWRLLGVAAQVDLFDSLLDKGRRAHPGVGTWMAEHPHQALRLANDWDRLLAVTEWIGSRDGSSRYLRQIDVGGVDTKFIEAHRGVLGQLLDRVLDIGRIDFDQPRSAFALRYGFLDKPTYIRFRLLSPGPRFPREVSELTLRAQELAEIDPGPGTVIVVENEITYLAFPQVADALVLFGSGYSVSTLQGLPWMRQKRLHYWGDIDTHGFAILNRCRHVFPDVRSLLMDRGTLLGHRSQWVTETTPTNVHLDRLTAEEGDLYRDLVEGSFGTSVRLEQERVNYQAILDAVERL